MKNIISKLIVCGQRSPKNMGVESIRINSILNRSKEYIKR